MKNNMENKNELTVIIPVHKPDVELLKNSIKSVENQKVLPDNLMFVVNSVEDNKIVNELTTEISKKIAVKTIKHDKNTNVQSQLNIGVENCETKWFIFLEQDDELATIWVDNVIKYRNDSPDVKIFLPMVLDVTPKNEFLNFTNEAVWASQFSDELGILDNAALLRYQNFNIDGMAVEVESYKEFGGLKESIKLSFIYEFLLRMTYNPCKIKVIPKLGYKHVNDREGSLFNSYKNELTVEESEWWLSLAKKEYFHISDRGILYEKKND